MKILKITKNKFEKICNQLGIIPKLVKNPRYKKANPMKLFSNEDFEKIKQFSEKWIFCAKKNCILIKF